MVTDVPEPKIAVLLVHVTEHRLLRKFSNMSPGGRHALERICKTDANGMSATAVAPKPRILRDGA